MKKELKTILICAAVTLLYCAAVTLWPLFFSVTGDEMGYCVLLYYMLFPAIAFVCGCALGGAAMPRNFICGAGYVLLTFLLGIIMPWPVFHSFWTEVAVLGAAFAAAGFIFRLIVRLAVNGGKGVKNK
ncbi:MAG: hypothetical protein ACI4SS_04900 [Clostridia bacterium]